MSLRRSAAPSLISLQGSPTTRGLGGAALFSGTTARPLPGVPCQQGSVTSVSDAIGEVRRRWNARVRRRLWSSILPYLPATVSQSCTSHPRCAAFEISAATRRMSPSPTTSRSSKSGPTTTAQTAPCSCALIASQLVAGLSARHAVQRV